MLTSCPNQTTGVLNKKLEANNLSSLGLVPGYREYHMCLCVRTYVCVWNKRRKQTKSTKSIIRLVAEAGCASLHTFLKALHTYQAQSISSGPKWAIILCGLECMCFCCPSFLWFFSVKKRHTIVRSLYLTEAKLRWTFSTAIHDTKHIHEY